MANFLVFSGESFLGGHVCHALRAAGHGVTATAWKPVADSGHEACDLADATRVEEVVAVARPDHVIQCAGVTWTQEPGPLYGLHVQGTLNVLGGVTKYAPSAPVVLLGSAAEYGTVRPEALPVREDYPAAPTSFFGASKLAQTNLARAAAAEWKLSIAVARPFNILGPGLPAHYFAAALAQRLRKARAAGDSGNVPVTNAQATRDFVDVRDVAAALIALATHAAPPRGVMEAYNVASGQETTILAVAEKLCALAGGFHAVAAGEGESRSGISRSCGDGAKLRRAAGWEPRVGWGRSVEETWGMVVG
jgi:GDP-4-dehydro-6-deoxy-D-mannose reductase